MKITNTKEILLPLWGIKGKEGKNINKEKKMIIKKKYLKKSETVLVK